MYNAFSATRALLFHPNVCPSAPAASRHLMSARLSSNRSRATVLPFCKSCPCLISSHELSLSCNRAASPQGALQTSSVIQQHVVLLCILQPDPASCGSALLSMSVAHFCNRISFCTPSRSHGHVVPRRGVQHRRSSRPYAYDAASVERIMSLLDNIQRLQANDTASINNLIEMHAVQKPMLESLLRH